MRLALDARRGINDDRLKFGAQLGATDVVAGPGCFADNANRARMTFNGVGDRRDWNAGHSQASLSEQGAYDFPSLMQLRIRVEEAGLQLAAIENVPYDWYDKIVRGLPGRDEQIANWKTTLKNMGAAGIPILGYHFMGLGVWRTSRTKPGRGGAAVTAYDHEAVKNAPTPSWGPLSDEQMWDNLEYFIKAVIPVAEDAGVKMGLHPDDPPISPIAGVARIMRSHAALRRLTEDVYPSPNNALEFCQGTVSEMPDDIYDGIRYFAEKGKILYVHFRNVSGTVPAFDETFIDEGHVDMHRAMQIYSEAGFEGPMIDDHVPHIVGDTASDGWPYRSEAFAMGYYKALINVARKDREQVSPIHSTESAQ